MLNLGLLGSKLAVGVKTVPVWVAENVGQKMLRTFSFAAITEIRRFCADESGATAIEYAMVAAGVGGTVATTVWTLGSKLKSTFYDKLAAIFP